MTFPPDFSTDGNISNSFHIFIERLKPFAIANYVDPKLFSWNYKLPNIEYSVLYQRRTSAYCMIKCLRCPSENTERTYSPGFPWLSRTKKSPCCFNSSWASILGIAPWYQSCSANGFSVVDITSKNLGKILKKNVTITVHF